MRARTVISAVVFLVSVIGCERRRTPSAKLPPETGSAVGSAPDIAPVSPRLLDSACPLRTLGPDPGPTQLSPQTPPVGRTAEVADVADGCVKHTDCKQRDHGRCVHQAAREVTPFGQPRLVPAHNECVYDECTSDDECRRTGAYEPRAELVCACAEERNTCTFANCRQDSDCPQPFTCGAWRYCHSAADECRNNDSCKDGKECVYSWEAKHYVCKEQERIAPD